MKAFVLIIVPMLAAPSCAPGSRGDRIHTELYAASAHMEPRVDGLTLEPIGLRLYSTRTILVDLVIQGQRDMAIRAASAAEAGIYFDPTNWIQLETPEGDPVSLSSSAVPLTKIQLPREPEATFPLGGDRIRVVQACSCSTAAIVVGREYALRLNADYIAKALAAYGSPTSVDDGWHTFEVLGAELILD